MAITVNRNAFFGVIGNSISTYNGGGAVPWQLPLKAYMDGQFAAGAPLPDNPWRATTRSPSNVTDFDIGAPIWSVSAVSGQNLDVIRTFVQNLPSTITHLFVEAGTNDVTNLHANAVDQADLAGIFTDAIARFPGLRGIFYLPCMCVGEKYGVAGSVATFQGNPFDGAGIGIDGKNAALLATCQAAGGGTGILTNTRGQTCPVVYVDLRAAGAEFLRLFGPGPPGVDGGAGNGNLTVDNKHPKAGGWDVVARDAIRAQMTIVSSS